MIEIKELCKIYDDDFYSLKDINLLFKTGELSLIYGESGSGKSTLLSIIAAISKPTSGEIRVDGENIAAYNDYFASSYREKQLGFITQEFHLFESFSVAQNISVALTLSGISLQESKEKVLNIAKKLGIEHKLQSKISSLSGGEKQRCIIARALVNEPQIILCDEPTANLDRSNALKFIEILKEIKREGKSIIVVTHDTIFDNLDIVDARFKIKDGVIE